MREQDPDPSRTLRHIQVHLFDCYMAAQQLEQELPEGRTRELVELVKLAALKHHDEVSAELVTLNALERVLRLRDWQKGRALLTLLDVSKRVQAYRGNR